MKVLFWVAIVAIPIGLVSWGFGSALDAVELRQDKVACVDKFEQLGITFDQCMQARR